MRKKLVLALAVVACMAMTGCNVEVKGDGIFSEENIKNFTTPATNEAERPPFKEEVKEKKQEVKEEVEDTEDFDFSCFEDLDEETLQKLLTGQLDEETIKELEEKGFPTEFSISTGEVTDFEIKEVEDNTANIFLQDDNKECKDHQWEVTSKYDEETQTTTYTYVCSVCHAIHIESFTPEF